MIVVPITKVEERYWFSRILAQFVRDVFGTHVEDAVFAVQFMDEAVKPEEVEVFAKLPSKIQRGIIEAMGYDGRKAGGFYIYDYRLIIIFVKPRPYWRSVAAEAAFHESVHHILMKDGNRALTRFIEGLIDRGHLDATAELGYTLTALGLTDAERSLAYFTRMFFNEYAAYMSTVIYVTLLLPQYTSYIKETAAKVAKWQSLQRVMEELEYKLADVRAYIKLYAPEPEKLLPLVDEVKNEVYGTVEKATVQEYTCKFIKWFMSKTPIKLIDRYPEIFSEHGDYLAAVLGAVT